MAEKRKRRPRRKEVYVSVDIEVNGPIPGPHSMLSLGAAAFSEDGELIDTFSVNLETLPGSYGDPDTMKWWSKNKTAWRKCRSSQQNPRVAMKEFDRWVRNLPGRPVCAAYPATFDFMFIYWYFIAFLKRSPFGFSAIDIHSYAMGSLGKRFSETRRSKMPQGWFVDIGKHRHVALDDALFQGKLFMNMVKDARTRAHLTRFLRQG